MSDCCDQCGLPFENAEVYLELSIETTIMTHTEAFCCLKCLQTWIGDHIKEEDE